MPIRSIPLVTDHYYHIFNRGVAHQPIFLSKRDYERFVLALWYYRFKIPPVKLSRLLQLPQKQRQALSVELETKRETLVDVVSFSLMPNHFHLLIRQNEENGISNFVNKLTNSYAHFFNTKHERQGHLLQGTFKAVHIENEEQLVHVSRYVHINPWVSFIIKEAEFFTYPWSSLPEFFEKEVKHKIVNPNPILVHFPSVEKYKEFLIDQVDYGKKLEEIKHLILE